MNEPRKKLSDILLLNSDRERLSNLWKMTAAAAEFAPLPPGEYPFRVLSGELFTAKRGTPGYKLTLEVTEGEFEGRRAWCDFWLTPAALPMTKRDLAKLGVTDLNQLEQPLPQGILIKGKLALRRDDEGNESNKLVRFECTGVEPGDAFEPPADQGDQDTRAEPDNTFNIDVLDEGTQSLAPTPELPTSTNGAATTPKGKRKGTGPKGASEGGNKP